MFEIPPAHGVSIALQYYTILIQEFYGCCSVRARQISTPLWL